MCKIDGIGGIRQFHHFGQIDDAIASSEWLLASHAFIP